MIFFSELGHVANRREWCTVPPTNTARTELHSMITLHHANTRASRAAKLRIAHLCVPPAQTRSMILDLYLPCDVPRQSGGSTQIPPLTDYEPKSVEIKVIETEAIEPADLEPRRTELDKNLGTDPYHLQERFMRNSITEDVDDFSKLVQRRFTSSHRCIPIMTQRRALQTRILKMANCENAGFTTVYAKSRGL